MFNPWIYLRFHWKSEKRNAFLFLVAVCTLVTLWIARDILKNPEIPKMGSFNKNELQPVIYHESDLLHSVSVKLNIGLLKEAYIEKIKDLKKRNVWKSFSQISPCTVNRSRIVCLDTACNSSSPDPASDANLQQVFKPLSRVKDVSERLRQAMGPYERVREVTFVTAASSNHYEESQALLKNLHQTVFPYLKNFTFYYYDLGLTPLQRRMMMKYCKCQMRSFPFKMLPERFAYLKGYTFKPIILQALLPQTGILIWVDSSIRFRTGNLKPLFDLTKSVGLLWSNYIWSHAEFTSKTMFDYFDESPCHYSIYKQFESGFVVMHNEPFTRDVLVKTWWACAIDPECMCTYYNRGELTCNTNIRKYAQCHRYDQAGLTMILAKLFREHAESFYVAKTFHVIRQGHSEKYFAQLEANRSTTTTGTSP